MQTGFFLALIRLEGYRRIHIYQPVEWDRIGDFFMTDLMIYLHLKIQIRGKTILSCLNKRAVV